MDLGVWRQRRSWSRITRVAVTSVTYRRGIASMLLAALPRVAALELALHLPLRFSGTGEPHSVSSSPVPQARRVVKIGDATYMAQSDDVSGETRYQLDAVTSGGPRMRVGMTGTNDTKLSFSAPAEWGSLTMLEVQSCNQFSC